MIHKFTDTLNLPHGAQDADALLRTRASRSDALCGGALIILGLSSRLRQRSAVLLRKGGEKDPPNYQKQIPASRRSKKANKAVGSTKL